VIGKCDSCGKNAHLSVWTKSEDKVKKHYCADCWDECTDYENDTGNGEDSGGGYRVIRSPRGLS